jgi:predicted phosphate transport protein (TIGR00153 family)
MSLIREMFTRSPFEPLRHHMAKVMECVDLVVPMFESVRDGRHDELDRLANKVFKTEHEADLIKDEIRRSIPKQFFLPVYRGDLLAYLKQQDDMADSVEDVAVLMSIKRIALPAEISSSSFEYVESVVTVCRKARKIADFLPRLVEKGLEGNVVQDALAMVADLEKSEWISDRQQFSVSKELFALDDRLKATDIFLWFRVFGELGQLANHAEKAGERLRRMLST